MAVINIFESSAQLGAPVNNQANFRPDSSGIMAVARQDAGIAKTVVEGGNKLYEQMAVADVMKANNDINMRMNEVRNKLLQNKEQNALNNMTVYEEERRKIIDDVVKNGPASLRSGIGNRALMATVEKDWTSRKDFMERYQYNEMEKYQDTQLGNQYKLGLKNIADEYMSPEQVEENIRRGEAMTAYRYMNYGPEKVKQMQDRWRSASVATAVQASLTANNYDRAGQLLQGYGDYLDPAAKMQFDKVIQERKKSDSQILAFDDVYKQYGNDIEGALNFIKSNTGMADTAAGITFARSKEGEQWGDNTCAIFTSACITAAGGDERLKSTLSDGTYRNAEELGLTFSDRKQLRDGDLVYWSGTSQQYAVSDDPNSVNSTDKAYKGITHVGVYDANTGKVIQSGSSGVAAIDIDTYNVVGFSHIGDRELSPTEQKQQMDDYRTYAASRERDRRMADDALFNDWSKNLFAWKEQGVPWEQAMKDAEQWAGNDLDLYKDVKNAVNLVYKIDKAPGSGGSSGGLDYGIKNGMKNALGTGQFKNKLDFMEMATRMGASKADYNALAEMYDDWDAGKGEFAYKWSDIKKEVMEGSRLKGGAEEAQWNGAQAAGKIFIKDYVAKNHVQPSDYEVIDYCRKALTVEHYGSYVTDYGVIWDSRKELNLSTAQLARAGIKSVEKVSDDMYEITYSDGRIGGTVDGAYLAALTSY